MAPCKHGPGVASGAISSGFYRTTRTCDRLGLIWELHAGVAQPGNAAPPTPVSEEGRCGRRTHDERVQYVV